MEQAGKISISENRVAMANHQLQFTERQQKLMERIASMYFDTGFSTPDVIKIAEKIDIREKDVIDILQILLETGTLVKAEEGIEDETLQEASAAGLGTDDFEVPPEDASFDDYWTDDANFE